MTGGMARLVRILPTLALTVSLLGCGQQRCLLSQDEEIGLGRQAAPAFEQQNGGRDGDARRAALAATITTRIADAANSGDHFQYPYEVRILGGEQVNACAFPGGLIYLWRGLFAALDYDDGELAWIVGHEAAHVSRQHVGTRIEKDLGCELAMQLVLGNDPTGRVSGTVGALVQRPYDRAQELEADRLGAVFSHTAGYDPTAALAALTAFGKSAEPSGQLELLTMVKTGDTTREDNLKALFVKQGWSGRYFKP